MIHIALIALGVLAAATGAVVLWSLRIHQTKTERDRRSEPTTIVFGLVLLIVGYHLIVWGIPAASALQFPRDRWYLVIGGGVAFIVLSKVLDRMG